MMEGLIAVHVVVITLSKGCADPEKSTALADLISLDSSTYDRISCMAFLCFHKAT